jgi:hypothetical protein
MSSEPGKKDESCFYALQRTHYGTPLDEFVCYLSDTKCKNPAQYRSCAVWNRYKGAIVALGTS